MKSKFQFLNYFVSPFSFTSFLSIINRIFFLFKKIHKKKTGVKYAIRNDGLDKKSRQIDTSLPSNISQTNFYRCSLVKVQFFFHRGINLSLPIHRTVKLANLQEPRNEGGRRNADWG